MCTDISTYAPISEARKQEGDDSTLKGYTEVPTHSDMVVPETENWDDGNN